MTTGLADALLPPEWPVDRRPPGPRLYLPAGVTIACRGGHRIGTLRDAIPMTSWPDEPVLIVGVEPEQRLTAPGGTEADSFIDVGIVAHLVTSQDEDGDDRRLRNLLWPAGFDGRCRICGLPWLKEARRRDGTIKGFRIATPRGWGDRPSRRR